MAPGYVCALVISAGVISVTGLMARWMMGFEHSEIKIKSSVNSFTISSATAQTGTRTAQVITILPETASMKIISGSSEVSRASSAVATAEASQQTTAETAAASPAGPVETTARETTEEVQTAILLVTKKAETLETAETTPDETVITCTEITESTDVETLTDTTQKTPEPERISISDVQTPNSKTDVVTETKQELESTSSAQTITTANFRSATPIPEPLTDRVTTFIASTSKITPENKATTQTSLDFTVRTTAIATTTNADLTEGTLAPSTVINSLKTAGTEPFKVETSETATVGPQESTQAVKTSVAPTTINRATGLKLITMIQTATEIQEKTEVKQLTSTTIKSALTERKTANKMTTLSHKPLISVTKSTTGRSGWMKKPFAHDKTLLSAIAMGCILVICAILAVTVFVKDFIRHQ